MKNPLRLSLSGILCAQLACAPIIAAADDIDIFTGASAGPAINPRILIVLDNTSNWARQSQQWPGGVQQGQSEARAIRDLLADPMINNAVSMGLLEFVTGGNANDNGGFVRQAVRPMDVDAKRNFSTQLDAIYSGINSPDEKRNSHTPYGNLMYDVYNYFAGENAYSPGGVIASLADRDGYTTPYSTFRSPLTADNTCGKSFVVFIGNPNASGPAADDATNTSALTRLSGELDSNGRLVPPTQLRLPNFTTGNTTASTNVGTTAACYADATAAQAGIGDFTTQCSAFTEGCTIGAPTDHIGPVNCPSGSLSYSVVQSVYHPAVTTPGQPVQGTITSSAGSTTGYYTNASDVPASDRGDMVCPASTTTTNGNTTSTTTYSCTYTVGAPIGSASPVTSQAVANQNPYGSGPGCYKGVGTGTNYWNPGTTTDFGSLSCPANSTCTYSGALAGNSSGCTGSGYRQVTVTQSATPKRKFTLTQTVTPTTVSNNTSPAYTTNTVLGKTAQCYAAAPTTTSDYAASCTGSNVSCTYNNTPTSNTLPSCPPGSSAYKVDGVNIELTNVPTGTTTVDSAPFNADEWARLMHDKGVPVAGSSVRSPVTTFTIDVYNKQPNATHTSLLMSMAKAGGGKYFSAKNEQDILKALKQIVTEIQAVNTTFASTSLPVNATNRSQNENQVFIGMFRPDPDANPRWFGNLKRYQLINSGGNIELGDVNGKMAVNTLTGFVSPCATSYWTVDAGAYWGGLGINPDPAGTCAGVTQDKYSDAPDGPQVEKGGAAQVLRRGNLGTARKMMTQSGSGFVNFTTASSGLSDSLVRFIQGEDVNNEMRRDDPSTPTTRPSIHGDVIHSRPLPVNYGGSTGVRVFYGSNDGALHAVEAETGIERWSFVAPEFFARLGRLKDNSPVVNYPNISATTSPSPQPKDYFFDGSIGLLQNASNSQVWIFPTMRRGGRMLYAIDVHDPDNPVFKWKVGCPNANDDSGCTAGMSGIGQTWSTPNVAFIKGYTKTVGTAATPAPVLVVGGGYDSCEDANTATPSCSGRKGGFIYVIDADTGTLLRAFDTDRAVAADVAMVDSDNDGYPDFAYAADTGGNIYRVDFVAGSSRQPLAPDAWTRRKVAFTAGGGRKFLFAPALLSAPGKVYVALGSGDREHPLQAQYPYQSVVNRFYVYLDDLNAVESTPAQDLDALRDYSDDTNCNTTQVLPNSGLKGWYMNLNKYGRGEQTVTSALIASGMATFSTNRPIPADAASCSTSLGEARGYWVNLFNAAGAINVPGTCGGARSSTFVGGGLPPSPVKANSIPIDGKSVSVVIGAVQKGGKSAAGASASIAPQQIRPAITSKRKRVYNYTSGD